MVYLSATDYETEHCCPNHPESTKRFNLQDYLPSPLLTAEMLENEESLQDTEAETRTQQVRYRDLKHRADLDALLISWALEVAGDHDRNEGFTNVEDILPFSTRSALVKTRPALYRQHLDEPEGARLREVVIESDEWHSLWSEEILDIMIRYDRSLVEKK